MSVFRTASIGQLLLIRFEQGRGRGGVPREWLVFYSQQSLQTLVRRAVGMMRAACADEATGHGRDLLPGSDDEYHLHNVDGGVIGKPEDIVWETVEGSQRAELVLTWGLPSELLARGNFAKDRKSEISDDGRG